jgi:diadenosine tetraphosphate (Ap4A) HIT family hydrolase
MKPCPLCHEDGGAVVWRDDALRVVLAGEPDVPGFTRVIANTHAAEMSDLSPATREHIMRVVFRIEEIVRVVFSPVKINLASLGNVVPHVHWHVVPRFADDPFYPQSVWSARQRETPAEVLAARRALEPALQRALATGLAKAAP